MGLGAGLWRVFVFSHFRATVPDTGSEPPPDRQFAPSSLPWSVPHPTILAISTDPRKLPPLLQVVPPATADPQIDLH